MIEKRTYTIKNIIVAISLAIMMFGCSQDQVNEEELWTCSDIEQYFSNAILQEALNNGYVQGQTININTTDPLSPGYMDIDYDNNLRIWFEAMALYLDAYNLTLELANCN